MTNQISESRFYMWRAVFAMAHVDGKISAEELEFACQYLDNAGFSEEQTAILKQDLQTPQNVGEMLSHVTALSDQADFFQFSHMLAWKDGDYSSQEERIINRLNQEQMQKFNKQQVAHNIREARKASILRRALEDHTFAAQARDVSGLANVLRHVIPWMQTEDFKAPDADMFKLWRAVFSLVHADDDLAAEEREYIEGMMSVFHFSEEQKSMIEQDFNTPPDTLELFQDLKNARHRKQFFILARTVIWCDGVFHDREREAIAKIKSALGNDVAQYREELDWIDRQPENTGSNDNESMMQDVVRQMLAFYKEQAA